MRYFRRKNKKREIFRVKSIAVDPETIVDPHTAQEYARRGMAFFARQQYARAERDLRAATALDSELLDGHYGLGMVFKASGDWDASRQAFQQVIRLLEDQHVDNDQARMLTLLAQGHLHYLSDEAARPGEAS